MAREMTTISATLAWAVPVQVEVLGANLEAYGNLLPTLNAVRACHRFGTSSPISRLPPELLLCIEDYLIMEERDKTLHDWRQDFACFRHTCKTRDHFNSDDIQEYREEFWEMCSDILFQTDESNDQELDQFLANHDPYHERSFDIHLERRQSWKVRAGSGESAKPTTGPFNQELMLQHFGLSVWTSHYRLSDAAENDPYLPDETTLAYLRVPGPSIKTHEARLSDYECDAFPIPIQTSCAITVETPPALPSNAQARFKRAMKILGLTPSQHESQQSFTLQSCPSDETHTAAANELSKEWPKLTMLISTTCEH